MSVSMPPAGPATDGPGAQIYLGNVSERFLRQERQAGRLKSFKVGRSRKYLISDLDAYIAMCQRESEQSASESAQPELDPGFSAARPRATAKGRRTARAAR